MKKSILMKFSVVVLIGASLGLALAGCHSGTLRGAGSDIEELGQKMKE